jgi:hypothetical protein
MKTKKLGVIATIPNAMKNPRTKPKNPYRSYPMREPNPATKIKNPQYIISISVMDSFLLGCLTPLNQTLPPIVQQQHRQHSHLLQVLSQLEQFCVIAKINQKMKAYWP